MNRDLILLYWDIGRAIIEKQETFGWGESVVEVLAKIAFPGTTGFLARNAWDMRRFYSAYSDPQFLRQAVAALGRAKPSNDGTQPSAGIDSPDTQPESLRQAVARDINRVVLQIGSCYK